MTPKSKTINLMLLDGGAGDCIAALVSIAYILKHYPWIKPKIWVPDYLLEVTKNVLPSAKSVRGFSDLRSHYNANRPTRTTKWDQITSPMKIHCLDYAFLKLCDENPSIEHKNYLQVTPTDISHYGLPDKYVVFTTGFTAEVREWPASEINKTATFVISKGYTPVFLGQTEVATGVNHTIKGVFKEEIDFKVGISLIDKTSLVEAASIMAKATVVLGVDNGLLHLAGMTQTAIIAGYTTVTPEIRMPVRHNELGWNCDFVVPDKTLDCKFCQEKTNFLYDHDYRNCLYKGDKLKQNLCTTQMTAEKFIAQLEDLL